MIIQKNFIRSLLAVLFLCLCNSVSAGYHSKEIESLLIKLDSVIAEKDIYVQQKELKIEELRKKSHTCRSLEEFYWLNKMFYDEYYIYDSDSAMSYVEKNLEIARKLHKKDWQMQWTINKSFLLSATGLLENALKEMNSISSSDVPPEMKVDYYEVMQFLFVRIYMYSKGEDLDLSDKYEKLGRLYLDSIDMVITREDPLYFWHKGWKRMGTDQIEPLKEELLELVQSSALETRYDAMNAYVLATIYADWENKLKYLIYSAIADVRSLNKEIASLEEISKRMFEVGDIDRAYNYVNYCLKNAQLYRNRIRVLLVSEIQDKIHRAYVEKSERQEARIHYILILISILSVILLMAVVYILKQMKRLSRSKKRLNEVNELMHEHMQELSEAHAELGTANAHLNSLNEQLKNANNKLQQSNYVKEEYIGYVFSICSNYINKLDGFRKDINRKIKAKKFDEVKALTDTHAMTQNELKEFYHNFDVIFLHVYPDFVRDFNTLLQPDEQIILKEGELLNTELRIYALVRLGINDSVRIAEFLHCSPQTVYNNRLKTRNKAIIPKEQFANAVKILGKVKI